MLKNIFFKSIHWRKNKVLKLLVHYWIVGDHFGMRNSALYCQKHYEMVLDENSSGSSPPPRSLGSNSPHMYGHHGIPPHIQPASTPYFNGSGTGQKGRPRKRKDTSANMGSIIEIGNTTPPTMQHLTPNLGKDHL